MEVNLAATLKDLDGVADAMGPDGNPITMRMICMRSLMTPLQEDKEEQKWEKYEIYKKIRDAGPTVDLGAEEIVKLKRVIGKTQPQLFMGQAFELLKG